MDVVDEPLRYLIKDGDGQASSRIDHDITVV